MLLGIALGSYSSTTMLLITKLAILSTYVIIIQVTVN